MVDFDKIQPLPPLVPPKTAFFFTSPLDNIQKKRITKALNQS